MTNIHYQELGFAFLSLGVIELLSQLNISKFKIYVQFAKLNAILILAFKYLAVFFAG